MLLKLDNPFLLSKAIELISELVVEVRIKVNEFGLSVVALDPANVAMVEFKLPRSAFSQFEVGNEVLGVNLENLKRVLKRCGPGSSIIVEKKENILEIQIQDRIKRNFSISLIEVETEDKEMPELDYTSSIEIESIDLTASIEDCAIVADACSFITKDGKFIIEAKGLNSARSEFTGDEATIQAEDGKSRYSLEYLKKIMKGAKLCEKTFIKFSNDHPVRIEFKTNHMGLNFVLAPRVETED